jgi:hypothetical protein
MLLKMLPEMWAVCTLLYTQGLDPVCQASFGYAATWSLQTIFDTTKM